MKEPDPLADTDIYANEKEGEEESKPVVLNED